MSISFFSSKLEHYHNSPVIIGTGAEDEHLNNYYPHLKLTTSKLNTLYYMSSPGIYQRREDLSENWNHSIPISSLSSSYIYENTRKSQETWAYKLMTGRDSADIVNPLQ